MASGREPGRCGGRGRCEKVVGKRHPGWRVARLIVPPADERGPPATAAGRGSAITDGQGAASNAEQAASTPAAYRAAAVTTLAEAAGIPIGSAGGAAGSLATSPATRAGTRPDAAARAPRRARVATRRALLVGALSGLTAATAAGGHEQPGGRGCRPRPGGVCARPTPRHPRRLWLEPPRSIHPRSSVGDSSCRRSGRRRLRCTASGRRSGP